MIVRMFNLRLFSGRGLRSMALSVAATLIAFALSTTAPAQPVGSAAPTPPLDAAQSAQWLFVYKAAFLNTIWCRRDRGSAGSHSSAAGGRYEQDSVVRVRVMG